MKIREIHLRWGGPIVLSAVLPLIIGREDSPYLISFLIGFAFSFSLWHSNCQVYFWTRRRFPEFGQTRYRLIALLLGSALCTFVVATLVSYLVWIFFLGGKLWDNACYRDDLMKSFYISMMAMVFYEMGYFFERWKASLLETEKLKTQHIQAQLETLKNQLSPHFLFNSLNTLISLIPEDAQLATRFAEELSRVYRYILQNQGRELVSLRTELSFIRSYVFLQGIRFGNNLQVDYQIEEKYLDDQIAPLTLQMLVENAIKHNVVSVSRPLHIQIYIDNGQSIIVKNNLQRKISLPESTKIGLENIRQRYQLLSHQTIDVIATAQNFMVALPLIRVS